MNIRHSFSRAAIFVCFVLPILAAAGDSPTIISEWDASFQLISTEQFTDWPGIESRVPIDVSAEAGRTWLIWPGAILNLNAGGHADARTLLALFASTAAGRQSSRWSAEAGFICSDGIWRSVDFAASLLTETDPFSGVSTVRPFEELGPGRILPARGGNILVIGNSGIHLLESGNSKGPVPVTRLEVNGVPLMGMAAVSRLSDLAAWTVAGEPSIRFSVLPLTGADWTDRREDSAPEPVGVEGYFWMMDWAGKLLVTAGPGSLIAIDPSGRGGSNVMEWKDSRLPTRWYRIRGGSERLLIHSPESGLVAAVGQDMIPGQMEHSSDFAEVLKRHAMEAGRLLEDAGLNDRAIAYYNWVLPLVRARRSHQPTATTWPELEQEISDRRAMISGNW